MSAASVGSSRTPTMILRHTRSRPVGTIRQRVYTPGGEAREVEDDLDQACHDLRQSADRGRARRDR